MCTAYDHHDDRGYPPIIGLNCHPLHYHSLILLTFTDVMVAVVVNINPYP